MIRKLAVSLAVLLIAPTVQASLFDVTGANVVVSASLTPVGGSAPIPIPTLPAPVSLDLAGGFLAFDAATPALTDLSLVTEPFGQIVLGGPLTGYTVDLGAVEVQTGAGYASTVVDIPDGGTGDDFFLVGAGPLDVTAELSINGAPKTDLAFTSTNGIQGGIITLSGDALSWSLTPGFAFADVPLVDETGTALGTLSLKGDFTITAQVPEPTGLLLLSAGVLVATWQMNRRAPAPVR